MISSVKSGHVVTSPFEHHSVLNACQALENNNVQVTNVSLDKDGRISASDVLAAIRPDTKLVKVEAVCYAYQKILHNSKT